MKPEFRKPMFLWFVFNDFFCCTKKISFLRQLCWSGKLFHEYMFSIKRTLRVKIYFSNIMFMLPAKKWINLFFM